MCQSGSDVTKFLDDKVKRGWTLPAYVKTVQGSVEFPSSVATLVCEFVGLHASFLNNSPQPKKNFKRHSSDQCLSCARGFDSTWPHTCVEKSFCHVIESLRPDGSCEYESWGTGCWLLEPQEGSRSCEWDVAIYFENHSSVKVATYEVFQKVFVDPDSMNEVLPEIEDEEEEDDEMLGNKPLFLSKDLSWTLSQAYDESSESSEQLLCLTDLPETWGFF